MDGREVMRLETAYLPESNETVIRMYDFNGELIHEQRMDGNSGWSSLPPHVEYGLGNMRYHGDIGVLEWKAYDTPVYYQNLDIDMREFDREQDAHRSAYRIEYDPFITWHTEELERKADKYLNDIGWPRRACVFGDIEWTGGFEYDEQTDIKEERGGALDEFLDEFKPQETIPERSDKQK